MELGRFMGFLHPVLIHFPIVLLITAVLLETVAFFHGDARLRWAGRILLLLGAVSTLFAFVCGNFAEVWAARSGISQDAMEYHEFLATVTSWLFVGLTAWRMLMKDDASRAQRGAWLAGAIAACVLLGLTGHHGAGLVYDRGAAVRNIGLQRPPTHEDLYTLTQRQDAASIFYSNMMHHVFGWMVLILSLILLMDQFSPKAGAVARRFGPFLLFAGGLFLLIFSDQDAWPLYRIHPFRPITDKEVLLHKTYAILMLAIGARGIWHALRRSGAGAASNLRVQDRVMAVFALVGGALLFTHVHSAAPYANVAVGVYIHHTVMGFVALCIGAVKILDDALTKPARWRNIAYPALMCLEAVLLVNYNEGLPWFMGYGDLNLAAAHGGLVAPLGPYRAELVFQPATDRLEVYVMRRGSATPVAIPASAIRTVVRVGDEATEVTMPANPGDEGVNAHFSAPATFLRGQPMFSARAHARIDGRDVVADFEPWIDKSLADGAHFAYVCPMHPQIGSQSPGRCSVCGMALQPSKPHRPVGRLHDPDYRLDVDFDPPRPEAVRPVHITLSPRTARTNAITPLDIVHTKPLHLIVVSEDLSFFDHVHPTRRPDGSLALDYAFPRGGDFLLYADFTPTGAPNQVFRIPVTVSGLAPPRQPLAETLAPARVIGDYRVELAISPYPAQTREETVLSFELSENGVPVTDLEPMLGAAGHCVILSEVTREYLHSHPLETTGARLMGPSVPFHTQFPRPGLYKIWAQFMHHGRPVIAAFVIRVK